MCRGFGALLVGRLSGVSRGLSGFLGCPEGFKEGFYGVSMAAPRIGAMVVENSLFQGRFTQHEMGLHSGFCPSFYVGC